MTSPSLPSDPPARVTADLGATPGAARAHGAGIPFVGYAVLKGERRGALLFDERGRVIAVADAPSGRKRFQLRGIYREVDVAGAEQALAGATNWVETSSPAPDIIRARQGRIPAELEDASQILWVTPPGQDRTIGLFVAPSGQLTGALLPDDQTPHPVRTAHRRLLRSQARRIEDAKQTRQGNLILALLGAALLFPVVVKALLPNAAVFALQGLVGGELAIALGVGGLYAFVPRIRGPGLMERAKGVGGVSICLLFAATGLAFIAGSFKTYVIEGTVNDKWVDRTGRSDSWYVTLDGREFSATHGAFKDVVVGSVVECRYVNTPGFGVQLHTCDAH